MVTIRVEPDCGNAPRKEILREVVVALAERDWEHLEPLLADDIVWSVVGERTWNGRDAVREWVAALTAVDEVVFGSLLTHGPGASVDGLLRASEGVEYGFCHVLRFTNAAKTAKILRVSSYLIGPGPH